MAARELEWELRLPLVTPKGPCTERESNALVFFGRTQLKENFNA